MRTAPEVWVSQAMVSARAVEYGSVKAHSAMKGAYSLSWRLMEASGFLLAKGMAAVVWCWFVCEVIEVMMSGGCSAPNPNLIILYSIL